MKFDTSGLDPELMVGQLAAAYGLSLTSPRFLPLGEDQNAFHWLTATADGSSYFVTAHRQPTPRIMDVDAAYTAVAALVTDCDLREAVAPLPTLRGGFTSPYQGWRLALFPCVPGTMAFDQPLSEASLRQLARIIHEAVLTCGEGVPERLARMAACEVECNAGGQFPDPPGDLQQPQAERVELILGGLGRG
jgi:hypothetical protein